MMRFTTIVLIGLLSPFGTCFAQVSPTTKPGPTSRIAAIRTPAIADAPRINGAEVYGQRPGRPFSFYVPVTGRGEIKITVENLPSGLTFSNATRLISGTAPAAGSYDVKITATNSHGTATRDLRIVIGDKLALTPPMGWNNYNAFRMRIDDKLIRAQADAMVASGLIDHGWTYLNIDDGWQGERKADGSIQGNSKFPDMKALGDYIHSRGLKYGLYSSPGPRTCAGFEGSYKHEDQDAATYGAWGVDYLKYDWCSFDGVSQRMAVEEYAKILPDKAERMRAIVEERIPLLQDRRRPRPAEMATRIHDLSAELDEILKTLPAGKRTEIETEFYVWPYRLFGQSLAKVDRDIVYSLCQYGMGKSPEWAASIGGNVWRTTRDITPRFTAVMTIVNQQVGLEKFAGPGGWNDPDMLEIGNGQLTADEMHMQMTQWAIFASPMLIGTDLSKMDALTLSIFRNDEVIAVNQDMLGKQGYRVVKDGNLEMYVKPLSKGRLAVALFNRGETELDVSATRETLGVDSKAKVRDVWRQVDLEMPGDIKARIAPHGAEMFVLSQPMP